MDKYECVVCKEIIEEKDLSKHFETHPDELNNGRGGTRAVNDKIINPYFKKNKSKFCVAYKI